MSRSTSVPFLSPAGGCFAVLVFVCFRGRVSLKCRWPLAIVLIMRHKEVDWSSESQEASDVWAVPRGRVCFQGVPRHQRLLS
jgi:hypothetical protein